MAIKDEKAKRKEIKNALREKEREAFEQSLPMSQDMFEALFEYLDYTSQETFCEHSFRMTLQFLKENNVANKDLILDWLESNGGHCDCEVLANVAELFDHLYQEH